MRDDNWGTFTFCGGFKSGFTPKTLDQLASESSGGFWHAVNTLLKDGSELAKIMAEDIWEKYSHKYE